MSKFSVVCRFADIAVKAKFNNEAFLKFSADYIYSGKTDMRINITKRAIRNEKKLSGDSGCNFSDAYLETLAFQREFSIRAASYGVLLFHASAIAVDGEAYLFAAPSGTGKSTHASLWRKMLGDRAVMINDDKPFLRLKEDGQIYVYGSPWNGKHRLSTNIVCPLKSICFLEQGIENHITSLAPYDAFPLLCIQTYFPSEEKACGEVVRMMGKLSGSVPIYKLSCNISKEAAELSYNTMKQGIKE